MKLGERTTDRNEHHVDERAYKFFSYGYPKYHWMSITEGLRPTAVLVSKHTCPVCAYCGRQALPIQGEHRDSFGSPSYYDKGHCCVCKDAMDELECKDKEEEIRGKMNRLLADLRGISPRVNPEVAKAMVQARAERDLKEIEGNVKRSWGIQHRLKDYGINLVGNEEDE